MFTTNYDGAVEACYESQVEPLQLPVPIASNSEARSWDPRFEVPIIHLHGSLASDAGKETILLTENDYATFRAKREMLFDYFRLMFSTNPVLYVGYSHRDANWKMIVQELVNQYLPSAPPPAYRIAPSTPAAEIELLATRGIETVPGGLSEFRGAVETSIGALRVEPHNLSAIERSVPSDLVHAFRENPAAVARLLNSWTYVNQADFASAPNTDRFFKGDQPNWSLIGQGINFQRDLEQQLVDNLLDWATDPDAKDQIDIVLGPAGYGTTTLLMAVAAWFVRNKIGSTLFLRPGVKPLPSDIEYAATRLAEPVILFIDNAADCPDEVRVAIDVLRAAKVRHRVVMGERLNEWRQRHSPIVANEYSLEPLSDDEIDRLLAALGASNALGRLADLSPELRVAAVREKHQKELLVAMRELTEGRAFDAIIEDEFRGVVDPAAQRLYAFVCAFSRTRSLARDQLCADALDINVIDMYETLRDSLEGLAVWETVDEARGIEALRARHQVIADIVWDRCLSPTEREDLLLRALAAVNLAFGIDAKAFEAWTRDEDGIDTLSGLEAKTRFFEDACRKDPHNPYVRQHYARMLRREQRYELALAEIDSAIELSPRNRILSHTRGVILRNLATNEHTSIEVARRRLAQAESSFKAAIAQNARDEYSYQSLAELYIEWAARITQESEIVAYLAKAQEVVHEGLQSARNREGLYLVSAKIQRALGDTPMRLKALRQALETAPTSAIVRYLLGKLLLNEESVAEAVEVLHEGVRLHPDDPNLCMTYALALHAAGRPYSESVAALNLARTRGVRDPAYAATLGGFLVMDEALDEAKAVFADADRRGFGVGEASRIAFVPKPMGSQLVLGGRVAKVGPGFAFVNSPGMPDFYFRMSRANGMRLVKGQKCSFIPGFSSRGPSAVQVEIIENAN
ncbi:MAG: SIR2 family protein [Nocardioides sp.]|uniref:P-loop NTPase n=1 Tax=Nocardioides sp. TaxID=35761 RepID=UPI0039E3C1C1